MNSSTATATASAPVAARAAGSATALAPASDQAAARSALPPAEYMPQVWKHNRLVEARYQLNTRASKIFALSVAKLRGRKAASLSVEFTVEEFAQLCDVNKHALYAELYELTKTLMQNQPVISIPLPPEEAQKRSKRGKNDPFTHVMLWPKISYKGEGVIEVHFHEDLRPYLLELTREFTRYDLLNVMRLSSTHTIRLYELLKEQLFRGEWKVEYADLKELLGIKPEQYPSMGNFRQRILNPAQKEIHKLTDIHFHYKPLKTGRKYTAIRFYITSRPAPHQQAAEIREISPEDAAGTGKPASQNAGGKPDAGQAAGDGVGYRGPDVQALIARHKTGANDQDYTGRWDAQQLIKYYRRNVLGIERKTEMPEALVTRAADLLRDFPALREGYFEQMDTLARKKIRLELEAFLREETIALILGGEWDHLAAQTGSSGVGESEPAADLEIAWDQEVLDIVRRLGSKSRLDQGEKAELDKNLAKLHPGVERIFDYWDTCCSWGKTKSRSKNRKDRFAIHVAESETFRAHWRDAIENAGKSAFMRGENSRKQKFAINCLLNEEFLEKLIEGEFNG